MDVSVWAGALTGYGMAINMLSPIVTILGWIGVDTGDFVRGGYWLMTLGWWGWQWADRGRTGHSLGQRMMGLKIVDEETRQPIGPGRSILRSLTHVLDVLPVFLGYLRPGWDRSQQTWADKIHRTVAVSPSSSRPVPESLPRQRR